jgi:hypothetical protein
MHFNRKNSIIGAPLNQARWNWIKVAVCLISIDLLPLVTTFLSNFKYFMGNIANAHIDYAAN